MAKQSLPAQGEGIRLEYTYKNVGAISFNLPSGGMVRGANSPTHRFIFVATQSDADHLVATGRFVLAPEPTEESEPPKGELETDSNSVVVVAPEPTEESEPKRRNRKSEE